MKSRRIVQCLLVPAIAVILNSSYASRPVHGQDSDTPRFRSRAEHVAEQRRLEQAYPELVRALRTLHLPPDKLDEAKTKLRKSEAATRAGRQELQLLEEENKRQGYNRQATNSARAEELRATLQQSTDQLHAEIQSLLTPQQRDQFDRHLQKQNRQKSAKQNSPQRQ